MRLARRSLLCLVVGVTAFGVAGLYMADDGVPALSKEVTVVDPRGIIAPKQVTLGSSVKWVAPSADSPPRDVGGHLLLRTSSSQYAYAPPGLLFAIKDNEVTGVATAPREAGTALGRAVGWSYFSNQSNSPLFDEGHGFLDRCSVLPGKLRKRVRDLEGLRIVRDGLAIEVADEGGRASLASAFEVMSDFIAGGSGQGSYSVVAEGHGLRLVVRASGLVDVETWTSGQVGKYRFVSSGRAFNFLYDWGKPPGEMHVAVPPVVGQFTEAVARFARSKRIDRAWTYCAMYGTGVHASANRHPHVVVELDAIGNALQRFECEADESPFFAQPLSFHANRMPPHAFVIESDAGCLIVSATGLIGVGGPGSLERLQDGEIRPRDDILYCWDKGGVWDSLSREAKIPRFFQPTMELVR